MRRRIIRVTAVGGVFSLALAICLGLVGCGFSSPSSQSSQSSRSGGTPVPPTPGPAPPPVSSTSTGRPDCQQAATIAPFGSSVAVLGDSYASGEGTYNTSDCNSDNPPSYNYYGPTQTWLNKGEVQSGCHRSPGAFAPLVGVAPDNFVACSGATIYNVEKGSKGFGAQTNILNPGIRVVVLSVSGDDLGFGDIIGNCTDAPGHRHAVQECADTLNKKLSSLPKIQADLRELWKTIEAMTHGAKIIQLGYPDLFPPGGHWGCNWITADKQEVLNQVTDYVDLRLKQWAEQSSVSFVDTRPTFADHEVCWSSGKPYINDLQINTDWGAHNCPDDYVVNSACSQSYHPNAWGYEAEARQLKPIIEQLLASGSPSPGPASASPAAQATVVKTFEPWVAGGQNGGSGPAPGLVVTNGGTATCDSGSADDPGSAVAVRCSPPGNGTPCFINDLGGGDPGSPLLCSSDPTSKQVIEVTPAGPNGIPAGTLNPGDPSQPPWFLILADGRKCHFLGYGSNTNVLSYDCGNNIGATVPDRSGPTWTVQEGQLQAHPAPSPARVAVVIAYRGKTSFATPVASPAPTPATPPPASAVVQDYYAAINAHGYQSAWSLGGKNLAGSYDSFVRGFANTASDSVTVTSVSGDTVMIQLDSTQTDGTHGYFTGTYTVQNGEIVSADVRAR